MDDAQDINIKQANNGWLLIVTNGEGPKEYELFEHGMPDFDFSADSNEHKLYAMRDMLISVARLLLSLNPDSKQTISVDIVDRSLDDISDKKLGERVEEAFDAMTEE